MFPELGPHLLHGQPPLVVRVPKNAGNARPDGIGVERQLGQRLDPVDGQRFGGLSRPHMFHATHVPSAPASFWNWSRTTATSSSGTPGTA